MHNNLTSIHKEIRLYVVQNLMSVGSDLECWEGNSVELRKQNALTKLFTYHKSYIAIIVGIAVSMR